jgi:ribosomal protein S18 acetylase RimI-like enzyme
MRVYAEQVWGCWSESKTRKYFSESLSHGLFQSILEDGLRVGVVSVEIHNVHYQLEQLYIEPSHQNRGLGESVVRIVIAKAVTNSMPVKLRVLRPNPAKRFYERLGFVVTKSTEERYFMEYRV